MAHGILRQKRKERDVELTVDSAGTGDYHVGESPDPRATEKLLEKGIDISDLRARQVERSDLDRFDRIYVMDEKNRNDVLFLADRPEQAEKVEIFLNLAEPGSDKPVPDPYFGGNDGFSRVQELLERACETLLDQIEAEQRNSE